MKAIGYITSTIIIATYSTMMSGWALTKLWSWFVVKTFGLPMLTIPAAIGLALIVEYMTKPLPKNDDEEYWKTLLNGAIVGTLKPLFTIGIGAIVRLWM